MLFIAKALEMLIFSENGCVSVRDTAREKMFVDYLYVLKTYSTNSTVQDVTASYESKQIKTSLIYYNIKQNISRFSSIRENRPLSC